MDDQTTPTFDDALYEEQAAYLAEHTDLAAKEAEAYLRRVHTPDDKRQRILDRELAKDMNVGKSTFSEYLNNAQEKLDGDEALINSLTTMLLTTDLGGAGGYSRQVIAAEKTMNACIILTETEFYDRDRYSFPSKYKAHIVYRENEPDIDFDNLPEDVIHYDKHSIFTVESSGKAHFLESVVAYINELNALEAYDLVGAANLLEDTFGTDVVTDTASDIIQDASGVIMDHEGQQ